MTRIGLNKIAFAFSALWVALAFVSLASILFVLPTFKEAKEMGNLQHSCYLAFSMMPHVVCRGFAGGQAVEFVLNVPIFLMFLPLYALYSLITAMLALAMWTPIVYFYYNLWRKKLWLVLFGSIAIVPSMFVLAWFYRYAA